MLGRNVTRRRVAGKPAVHGVFTRGGLGAGKQGKEGGLKGREKGKEKKKSER